MKGPDCPLATGDQIVLRAGLMRLRVTNLERLRRLELEVHFPFGIVNHEAFIPYGPKMSSSKSSTCRRAPRVY